MRLVKFSILSIIVTLIVTLTVKAQDKDFSEQIIGWGTINFQDPVLSQLGVRYIPDFKSTSRLTANLNVKTHLALNTYMNSVFEGSEVSELDFDFKAYRLIVGLSGNKFDTRLGLQKINFGSASLLRPLMWFDKIDPRDPLQLTDGVYSILGRYYFLNNANIWLWALYGNDDKKGWEMFKSNKNKPELGGRIQLPVFDKGEIAATYHYREGVFDGSFADTLTNRNAFYENRYAIDGKFDLGIGLWFEGSIIQQNLDFTPLKYQRLINVGVDYTFGIGNGLNTIAEYFTYQKTDKVFGKGEGIEFGALSLNYPINIINNVQAIVYYDITNDGWYRFINYSLTFDNWVFYLSAFWNPENYQIYQNMNGTNLYGGYGAQLMIVFNH